MFNKTLETEGWRSEPANRGTWGLMLSCVTTLVICVYNAVHLNVPEQGITKWKRFRNKTTWVIMGILAPELVLYTAWCQWYSAKMLTEEINRILKEKVELRDFKLSKEGLTIQDTTIKNPRQHPWTMAHSYLAGMGGFAFDTNDPDQPAYIPGSVRMTLTNQGVLKLAEHRCLADISESAIGDKSKADFISKMLAVLQASWLLIQCIARWKLHLTVTFLELNTFSHAIYALLIYLLWSKKPYDVHEPFIITGELRHSLCAVMWMFSEIQTETHSEGQATIVNAPEIERLLFADTSAIPLLESEGTDLENCQMEQGQMMPSLDTGAAKTKLEPLQIRINTLQMEAQSENSKSEMEPAPSGRNVLDLAKQVIIPAKSGWLQHSLGKGKLDMETGFGPKEESIHFKKRKVSGPRRPAEYYKPSVEISWTSVTLSRWQLAASVLRGVDSGVWRRYAKVYGRTPEAAAGCPLYEFNEDDLVENFVCLSVDNWRSREIIRSGDTLLRKLLLSIATATYGGIHASAWNEYFVTDWERFLWRFSSIFIAASGALLSLRTIQWLAIARTSWRWMEQRSMETSSQRSSESWSQRSSESSSQRSRGRSVVRVTAYWVGLTITSVVGILAILVVLIYLAARLFLVIEALASLRQLPIDAYKTPDFVQLIPHL